MQNTLSARAVIGLDVLIDDPDILKPATEAPKVAEELYIPLGYKSSIMRYDHERSNRGDACRELEYYLPILLTLSEPNGEYHTTKLKNGTLVHFTEVEGSPNPKSSKDQAIALAKKLMAENPDGLKILASHRKLVLLSASNFIPYSVIEPRVYTGRRKVILPADCATMWYSKQGTPEDAWLSYIDSTPLNPNEYIEFQPEYTDGEEGGHLHVENIGRCSFDRATGKKTVIPLAYTHPRHKAYHRIFPKTPVQAMMFDALLAPVEEIPMVMFPGIAGSGKTFCSVSAGLSEIELENYDHFFVVKSESTLGRDHGFLPGNLVNKILPLGASVVNALRATLELRDQDNRPGYKEKSGDASGINFSENPLGITPLMQSYLDNYFQFMPLRFIKGMSVPNAILYFDEAQDFNRDQITELMTRCGEGSKLIFTGDPAQSDFASMSGSFSGLDYVARRLSRADYVAIVRPNDAESCVRSYLVRRILGDIGHF